MPGTRRAETAWPAVLIATLCGVAVSMNIGKMSIALPQLRDEFGLSLVAAGWLVSTFNTIAMLCGVFIGMIADRTGAMRFCLAGLGASVLGALIALCCNAESALLISRVVEGLGFIAVAASAPALVSTASAPAQRRMTLSIWSCYMPAGASLCVMVAPLATSHGGWRGLWVLVLVITIGATIALVVKRADYSEASLGRKAGLGDVKQALHQPAAWFMALALACYALQFFSLVTWLPTFLREQRGFSTELIAILTAIMIAVNVPGNLLGGVLLHHRLNRGLLVAGSSLATGLCSLGIYTDILSDTTRYALCLALNVAGGIVPATVISSSAVLASKPQQVSTLQGLFMQASNLGQFVGMPLIAAVVAANGGGWHAALAVTLPAAALGIGAGVAVLRMKA
jgi:predicted MFS family arabinose efflux permease